MKKILALLILIFLTTPAFAQIQPPPWSEFCPPEYVNSQYSNYEGMSGFKDFLFIVSIFGAPKAIRDIEQKNEAKKINYWTNRREQYMLQISACSGITNKNMLAQNYLQIQKMEYEKNYTVSIDELQTKINQIKNELPALEREYNSLVDEYMWTTRRTY